MAEGCSTTKTLVYVPRMFSREEFRELVGEVPEDFDRTSEEFWEYVNERLRVVAGRVRRVYSDSFPNDEGKPHPSGEESAMVEALVKNGAQLQMVEDPLLAAEARAWLEMMRTSPSRVVFELYEECLREMSKHVVDVIVQTLKDGEMGVLFVDPSLKTTFPDELRVIRMFPFDPQDYLNRHRVKPGK